MGLFFVCSFVLLSWVDILVGGDGFENFLFHITNPQHISQLLLVKWFQELSKTYTVILKSVQVIINEGNGPSCKVP